MAAAWCRWCSSSARARDQRPLRGRRPDAGSLLRQRRFRAGPGRPVRFGQDHGLHRRGIPAHSGAGARCRRDPAQPRRRDPQHLPPAAEHHRAVLAQLVRRRVRRLHLERPVPAPDAVRARRRHPGRGRHRVPGPRRPGGRGEAARSRGLLGLGQRVPRDPQGRVQLPDRPRRPLPGDARRRADLVRRVRRHQPLGRRSLAARGTRLARVQAARRGRSGTARPGCRTRRPRT